jgi:hypothetical protein
MLQSSVTHLWAFFRKTHKGTIYFPIEGHIPVMDLLVVMGFSAKRPKMYQVQLLVIDIIGLLEINTALFLKKLTIILNRYKDLRSHFLLLPFAIRNLLAT